MKVIVSVGGRFHAVHLATQLHERGALERFITTKRWYYKEAIPERLGKAIPLPEVIGTLVRKIPALRAKGYYSYVKDNLFDALARKYVTGCDVFHAWGNYGLISMASARELGAKIVIERGSTHPHYQDEILSEEFARYGVAIEKAHPQIIKKGLEEIDSADKVIIPSEFVRRTFIERGISEDKLSVSPYGFDASNFRKSEKTDDTFRAILVGNIGIQKGVHYLLQAWQELALPNSELVLIGRIEEEMKPVLKKYEGTFTYRGHVKHEELYKEYGNASVFVLPSLQEGSALVTYEAMACGLPLIVSENTGSVVRDGKDGYILPIRDVEGMKEKLAFYYENRDQAAQMGDAAHEYVQQFSWAAYADRVMGVYREITGGTE